MTAQEQGMNMVAAACRQIVPPALDFVVLIYNPDGEIKLSSVECSRRGKTSRQQYERMREAAKQFLALKADPQFNAEEN